MRKTVAYIGRAAVVVCAAAAVLGQVGTASALSLDVNEITALKQERKRANADGKLPLPGTPDLGRLDQRLTEQGVASDAPVFIRVFKAESIMEVWTGNEDGVYRLFASYPICYWSGTLGPKMKEGDKQAPEGFYTVNLEQAFHKGARWPLALDIGYPNAFDQVNLRSGSAILIHGGCASIGCFAMTNAVSMEVHKLTSSALGAGQPYVPVHVFPFRMTEENIAKYDASPWSDFWQNLKEGYDLFERTKRPPNVSVCGTRYHFQPAGRLEGYNPGPVLVCPETAQVIAEISRINSTVAEAPPVKTEPSEIKTASIATPASFSYLGMTAATAAADKLGENFEQRLAPQSQREGVSNVLTRPLQCSLALPSCRRYASLRARVLHKTTLRLEEPEREKARTGKKKKKQSKKKSRSKQRHSAYESEVRNMRAYRAAPPPRQRDYRHISISSYSE